MSMNIFLCVAEKACTLAFGNPCGSFTDDSRKRHVAEVSVNHIRQTFGHLPVRQSKYRERVFDEVHEEPARFDVLYFLLVFFMRIDGFIIGRQWSGTVYWALRD